jgi:Tol biopolymer transport system component
MNVDGSERTLLRPDSINYTSMSSCGDRFLVFDIYEENKSRLYRTDADGTNPVKLSEHVNSSKCSPDGKWVLYDSGGKLYRLPIEGGTPTEIASSPMGIFGGAISPDGQWIAYGYQEGSPVPLQKVAVIPATGGSAVHVFDRPTGATRVRWSPDQKGLQYLLVRNGAANVWEQLLASGTPRQITSFPSGDIFDFSWTRDGKQLLLAKGEWKGDVVLISNFR